MSENILNVQAEIPGRLNVHLSLGEGCTAILGQSGAGKTTLLHLLAGLLPQGDVTISHRGEIWQDNKRTLPPEQRGVGLQFQESRLFPHLTVRENLDYPRRHGQRICPPGEAWPLSPADCAEALGISHLLDRPADALSGGEERRVALARALAAAGQVLLLDEPLGGLDDTTRDSILPWLYAMLRVSPVPILLVTHSLSEAMLLAQRVVVLDGGRVTADGSPEEILPGSLAVSSLREEDAENLLLGTVEEDGRSVRSENLALSVAAHDLLPGTSVSLRLKAADVLVGLSRHDDLSAQNVLDGTVTAIHEVPDGVLASVDAGAPLLVSLTHQAVEDLDLAPGRAVVLYIKTTAVRVSASPTTV
ncbi:MAG: ATP-binding cassette domain-containing protein [Planctomycetota bacterium]|nr:ATP-binding cassette domain-containing protein [Planctomycetota bacterium]